MDSTYHVPKALTVLSGIFLVLGGLGALIIIVDIVWRRGWKSMMWIMIPTYPITATYTVPLGLYLYFKYGRARKPGDTAKGNAMGQMDHSHMDHSQHKDHEEHHHPAPATEEHHLDHSTRGEDPEKDASRAGQEGHGNPQKANLTMHDIHMHDMGGPPRPLWATVLVGVSHCGAGCVLGDLVGEWLVYGTGAMIRGHDVWPALLVDYGFALLFGIFFQYFSIAPMSGEYGFKTVVRAAKADILSLTAFEIGLFGWMIAYQVGIFGYKLEMNTWLYWWMMQVGMFLGFWTAAPVNWWLITRNIKEPCA